MALLATQDITTAGLQPAYTAAAGGGDTMVPDDRTFLHVKNGSGAPITVTMVTPGTVDTLAIADRAVSVTNALDKMIRVPADIYRDSTTGLASITYSAVTSVTVAAIRI